MASGIGSLFRWGAASPSTEKEQEKKEEKKEITSEPKSDLSPELKEPEVTFENPGDLASYCLGVNAARTTKDQFSHLSLNPDLLKKGFNASVDGKKLPLKDEEIIGILLGLGQERQAAQQAATAKLVAKNQKEAQEYFKNNPCQDFITLPSGLKYKVLQTGSMTVLRSPVADDVVMIHYKGSLLNGKVIADTYTKKSPQRVEIAKSPIQGWSEALQKMKQGDKWKLIIPPELAFANIGNPQSGIEPGATLIFELELVYIA